MVAHIFLTLVLKVIKTDNKAVDLDLKEIMFSLIVLRVPCEDQIDLHFNRTNTLIIISQLCHYKGH